MQPLWCFRGVVLLYPGVNRVNDAPKVSKTLLKLESTAVVYDLTECFLRLKMRLCRIPYYASLHHLVNYD